jgi:PAS domain S-box-containing protein
MPDAPLDPVRAEVERLHARVSELETELTRLREERTDSPGPEGPPSAPAQRIEARFLDLLEGVGMACTLLDASNRVLRETPAGLRMFGCESAALRGQDLLACLHPDDRPDLQRFFEQVLSRPGETIGPVLFRGMPADGRCVWVEAFACNRLDEPDVRGVIFCWYDVTARRQAEQALREREEQSRQSLEALRRSHERSRLAALQGRAFLWERDEGRSLVEVDPSLFEWLGYEPRTGWLPVQDLAGLHPPDDWQRFQQAQRQYLTGESAELELEYRMRHRDGSVRWVLTRARVIRDPAGAPVRLLGLTIDISERKQAEEERQQTETRKHHAQHLESLGVLAGGIAHDFNNLLTTIIGYTDLARAEVPLQAPAHSYLGEVLTAGRRAADLTQQVLAYAGKGRFVLQQVVLSELVQQMRPLLTAAVSARATLALNLASSVPAVEADISQLRQVILALVSNASEALGDQEGRITIRTAAVDIEQPGPYSPLLGTEQPPGRYALLEVSDTGVGMAAATQARIFEPFFTTKFTGRGLGLAAVLGIVRGHHGTIHVSSAPGKGARFRVLLPALPEAAVPVQTPEAATAAGKTVLLVEDEPAVRLLVVLMLAQAGYTVVQAADGQAGLDQFRQRPDDFDIVLLDLTMPRLDGLEVLAELRRLRPSVPVVLMTGYHAHDVSGRTGPGEANRLLQKPFTSEKLLAALGQALA